METSVYHAAAPNAAFATQSGPLLVIDGKLHPRFEENGASRFIRNGVGVRDAHTIVLAISRSGVSFGSFARLFRDALGCPNALYLDGVVSALTNGSAFVVGGAYPAGPIIAVSSKGLCRSVSAEPFRDPGVTAAVCLFAVEHASQPKAFAAVTTALTSSKRICAWTTPEKSCVGFGGAHMTTHKEVFGPAAGGP